MSGNILANKSRQGVMAQPRLLAIPNLGGLSLEGLSLEGLYIRRIESKPRGHWQLMRRGQKISTPTHQLLVLASQS